jgi:hypothetical protein
MHSCGSPRAGCSSRFGAIVRMSPSNPSRPAAAWCRSRSQRPTPPRHFAFEAVRSLPRSHTLVAPSVTRSPSRSRARVRLAGSRSRASHGQDGWAFARAGLRAEPLRLTRDAAVIAPLSAVLADADWSIPTDVWRAMLPSAADKVLPGAVALVCRLTRACSRLQTLDAPLKFRVTSDRLGLHKYKSPDVRWIPRQRRNPITNAELLAAQIEPALGSAVLKRFPHWKVDLEASAHSRLRARS